MFWKKKEEVPRPQWKMEKDLGWSGPRWTFSKWDDNYSFYRFQTLTLSEREAKIYCEHVGIPWED